MMRFSEYLTLLSTEGRTCRARGRGSGAGGRGAGVGPRRSGGAHGPIGASRRPEPPGAGVGRGAARGGAGAGRASEHAADEHVAVMRLHGQRPAVGDGAPAAAAHEGGHLLHTCTGVCVCVCVCVCVRVCVRVRVCVCVQRAMRATCSGVRTLADAWLSLMAISSPWPACCTWSGPGPE